MEEELKKVQEIFPESRIINNIIVYDDISIEDGSDWLYQNKLIIKDEEGFCLADEFIYCFGWGGIQQERIVPTTGKTKDFNKILDVLKAIKATEE